MDPEALRTLLSPVGLTLLDDVSGRLDDLGDAVHAVSRLRAEGHPPELVAAVLTQARLRRRAHAKFGEFASSMLFTEAGLEQATRLQVAALHAGRFREAGLTSVADLGCGIGADALALATLGMTVTAVERDEATAAVAAYNLAPFSDATVVHADAESVGLTGVDGVWLDPARRDGAGRRQRDAADWSPSLDFVFGLADAHPIGVKLGPGIDRDLIPADAEAQWVSVGRDTVEVVAWTGALARAGVSRAALVIGDDGAHELVSASDSDDAEARELGEWLYEPDGSVIRARLIGMLARQIGAGAGMVSDGIAYLTADEAVDTPFAQRFRVLETMSLDERAISQRLRALGIGRLEIKKRGADVDPARMRTRLKLAGDREATLFATRVGGRHRAILAERA